MILKNIETFIEKHLHNKQLQMISLFAIIVIPLSTYWIASKAPIREYTFSMIGNKLGYRISFILWGAITGIMLLFFILRLYILKSFMNKKARILLIRSLWFLLLTVSIPALEHLPILKNIHLISAIAFAISLITSLYLFTTYLQKTQKKIYGWSIGLLYFIIGGSLLLLFIFGNTGIFELFFFFMLTIFLIFLKYRDTNK